jgi:hypothetical protein
VRARVRQQVALSHLTSSCSYRAVRTQQYPHTDNLKRVEHDSIRLLLHTEGLEATEVISKMAQRSTENTITVKENTLTGIILSLPAGVAPSTASQAQAKQSLLTPQTPIPIPRSGRFRSVPPKCAKWLGTEAVYWPFTTLSEC